MMLLKMNVSVRAAVCPHVYVNVCVCVSDVAVTLGAGAISSAVACSISEVMKYRGNSLQD